MGFVNGDKTHAHVAYFLLKEWATDALGRNIKQFDGAEDGILEGLQDLVSCHARVDCCCADALGLQMVYLVFHECNERCDDDAHAV